MILQNNQVISKPLGRETKSQVLINDFIHFIIPTPEKGKQAETLLLEDLPQQRISVPLAFWKEHKQSLLSRENEVAVQLGAAETAEDIVDELPHIRTLILPFESVVDGRSYSHAYLLRTRYGFTGQIRAVGDVHMDQLSFLSRCGCDAFELPNNEDSKKAIEAFELFSDVYQPSADGGNMIFARRRAIH